ncbi:MAG: hypothetical protein HDT47_04250 [Ruminococcaceae bacterium]|nr:hypothetical protein [Oscillospiraceae bacterium]
MSYFTEQNYFVIASDNYQSFSSRIYGYVIDGNTMYHNYIFPDSSIPEFTKENVGFFTLIKKVHSKIEISMDAMGYGLVYYYNDGEFWAASNSFYKLMTYLKTRVKLTFDSEYGYLFSGVPHYGTIVHSRSLIKEIKLLALNEKIVVDTNRNRLSIVEFDFDPIVKMNTAEGLAAIDKWAHKWIKFVRLLAKRGEQINVQLSGGFDSRFVMALILASGIDMDKVNIESNVGSTEDFEIASNIAEHYNFKLNAMMMENYKHHNMDPQTILDANIFSRLGNHKEFLPYNHYICYEKPVFMFGGYGCMRCWFQDSTDGFIRFCYRECIDTEVSKEAIRKVCEETFDYVENRFNYSITRESNLLNYAYNYGKGRYNYGTSVQVMQTANQFMCSPISDPMLICIDPIYDGNEDYDILCCYVMYRFAPDLLAFPFDKNRSFKPETVEKAKQISDSMPVSFDLNDDFSEEPLNILTSWSYNGNDTVRLFPVEDFLKMFLEKDSTKDVYISYYGEDKFEKAYNAIVEKKSGHPERDAFGVFAVTECINACRSSWPKHYDDSFDAAQYLPQNRANIIVMGSGRYNDAFFLGQNNVIYVDNFSEAAVERPRKGGAMYILQYNDVEFAIERSEFLVFSSSEGIDEGFVEDTVQQALQINPDIVFVFRTAVSLGFTEKMTKKYGHKFIVNAALCRKDYELHDNINAEIIILGVSDDIWLRNKAKRWADALGACMTKDDVPTAVLYPRRAEALMLYGE